MKSNDLQQMMKAITETPDEKKAVAYQMPEIQYIQTGLQLFGIRRLLGNRTDTKTLCDFGTSIRFDLSEGFPLLTSKRVYWRGVVEELLWFLRGETNVKSLQEKGVNIWNEWADEFGNLGPVYGEQWRGCWHSVDQIEWVLEELKNHPDSRRAIVSAWNPNVLPDSSISPQENARNGNQALPPCHTMFQFRAYPDDDGVYRLHLQLYQRSADWFLGVPFNIASYALLLKIFSRMLGMRPGTFVHTFGDYHLYENHLEQFCQQVTNHLTDPRPFPELVLNQDQDWSLENVKEWCFEDFELKDYNPHAAIKAAVAV